MSKGLQIVEKMNENGHSVVFADNWQSHPLGRHDGGFILDLCVRPSDVLENRALASSHSSEEVGRSRAQGRRERFGFQVLRWNMDTANTRLP